MPQPGLEILTGILASSVTPMANVPVQPAAQGVLAEDGDAAIRLFHDRAFFASSGVDFDLYPVELDSGSRVLLSTATSSPDAPMLTGQGWMFLRDTEGNAAVILMNDSTTLEGVRAAVRRSDLAVAPVIVQDDGGFHLMVVMSESTANDIRPGTLEYAPAESVSSPATARFGTGRVLGFPFGDFAAIDGERVALDLGWGHSSADTGALIVDETDVEAIIGAPTLGADGGWDSFDRYASLERSGDAPILIQEYEVSVDGLGQLPGASDRAVPVREAQWVAEIGGEWQVADGSVRDAFGSFRALDAADYRITFAD